MYSLLLVAVLFLGVPPVQAQEYVVKNIKTDFGAVGDGVHNDHQAFMDASAFFNERKGNGSLVIPQGIYLVGKQLAYGDAVPLAYRMFSDNNFQNPQYKLGLPVLLISGCKNISVTGEPGATIKFADDMELGSFENGKPIPIKDPQGNMIVAPLNKMATIGDAIYIENSQGVRIANLLLEGNGMNHIMGGNISSDGWQWGQTGIMVSDVSDIRLSHLGVYHFAVDGIQIKNRASLGSESQKIVMDTCIFESNGRQGFSWTGGAGLIATGCNFSYTGRLLNKSLNAAISTAPGAGVDIEPESDGDVTRAITNGEFRNCIFEDNRGAAMVADLYDESTNRVAEDITFNDCVFRGVTFWTVWVTQPGFTFNRCRMLGSPVHSYSGTKPGKETKFIECVFEDIPDKTFGTYLVEIADGKKTTFDRCTFTSRKRKFYYLVSSDPVNGKFIVRDCKFINASGTDDVKKCIAEGVQFLGENKHTNFPGTR